MLFFPKILKSLDNLAEPYLHDFGMAIKKNQQTISQAKTSAGTWHSPAHFDELQSALFLEITQTINNILGLFKTNLESHKSGYKIKLRDAKHKIDDYINTLTDQARAIVIQESLISPELHKNQVEQLLQDFNTSCNNLRSKLHNEISLFINSLKLKNKKVTLAFKIAKYVATFAVGIFTKFLADNSNIFVLYLKKFLLLFSPLLPHKQHIIFLLHKIHHFHF